jgi:hypothetical protein
MILSIPYKLVQKDRLRSSLAILLLLVAVLDTTSCLSFCYSSSKEVPNSYNLILIPNNIDEESTDSSSINTTGDQHSDDLPCRDDCFCCSRAVINRAFTITDSTSVDFQHSSEGYTSLPLASLQETFHPPRFLHTFSPLLIGPSGRVLRI